MVSPSAVFTIATALEKAFLGGNKAFQQTAKYEVEYVYFLYIVSQSCWMVGVHFIVSLNFAKENYKVQTTFSQCT